MHDCPIGQVIVPGEWSFFHKNKLKIKNDPIVLKKERTHRTRSQKYWNGTEKKGMERNGY